MANGSDVYDVIKQQIRSVTSKSSTLATQLINCENKIESLGDEREQIFFRLADVYTPDELTADSVKSSLREFLGEVKRIFSERQARRQELESLMTHCQQKRESAGERAQSLTTNLNKKAEERDKTRKQIAEELQAKPEYSKMHEQATKAKEILEKQTRRIGEAQEEAEQKLPAYEDSKLFMYLVNRKFSTSNYEETGLTAKLDAWVAKIVNFAEAKKNYDFLRAMPEMMKQEVAKRQADLEKVVSVMREFENVVEKKYGLPEIIATGKSLEEQRKKAQTEVESNDSQYNRYTEERKQIDGKKDPYVTEAIKNLKTLLKGESIQELKARARETPGTEDDRLVVKIEEIDAEVRRLKDAAKQAQQDRDETEQKLRGLKDIERNFTSNDYESSRSRIDDGLNINQLLLGYLAGTYSSSHVNTKIASSQHFKPKETYQSSYSYSPRSSYGGGSSSSFGGFSGGGGSHSIGGF